MNKQDHYPEFFSLDTGNIHDIPIGQAIVFTKTVSESDVYLYAGITGDFSPNHIDAEYMKQGRYGERLAHGTLLVGLMSAASARMRLGRTVSLGYDRIRFIKGVKFGDTIATRYEITGIDPEKRRVRSDVTCTNQHGEIVAVAANIRAYVD